MILPTKRLGTDRCLLHLGAEVLILLREAKTVSRLWDDLKRDRMAKSEKSMVSYDWFVLALDLLYALHAVEYEHGRVRRTQR